MLILGIADNHDSGAALVVDGTLRAAIGQERLDRHKNSGAFPLDAMLAVLKQVGAEPADIDTIVLGTAFTPSILLRLFPSTHLRAKEKGNFSFLLNLYIGYQVALRKSHLQGIETALSRRVLQTRLADEGFRRARLHTMDHHAAHAHAAYRCQPEPECLVFTLDAMGDGVTAGVWRGADNKLEALWEQSGLAAVGLFYGRITEYLGFKPNRHEGKVTGLAACATPPHELLAHLKGLLRFEPPGFAQFHVLERQSPSDRWFSFMDRYSREEIAAAAQLTLEQAVVPWIAHWVRETGIRQVALSGGTFANVRLNQRIAESGEISGLSVYPHMGDGGLAAGAALGYASCPPQAIKDLYLGPEPDHVLELLQASGLHFSRPPNLSKQVVELLVAGKVVARCAGGMEWGPRALGNRSIFYRPDIPDVNDWLNKRLRRSEFMPFAPIVRQEDAAACFVGIERAPQAARFMTICFQTTEHFRTLCPGVVHVDGSARPQVLSEQENPFVHELLTRFQARTGLPALVNTSFNMHEEPIVCSAEDALRAWRQASLDALVLGDYLLVRE